MEAGKSAQSLSGTSRGAYQIPGRPCRLRLLAAAAQCPVGRETQFLPRLGRGSLGLLLIGALLAAMGWIYLQTSRPSGSSQALTPQSQSAGSAQPDLGPQESEGDARQDARPSGKSQRGSAPQFLGRGSIRGLVTTADGSALPTPFTVHVGPSQSLGGRQYAAPTSAAFEQAEFELSDLPLGGYDVWIEAAGMNSGRSPILLTQAAQHPYIIVAVSPMGYLDGYVAHEDGRPAEDLRVELAGRDGEPRLLTRTRADGYYIFVEVPDGEFRILFGPLFAPLVPARELLFAAPKMHFEKLVLPLAVDIQVRGTDGKGKPLANIRVSGFGKPSGRIEVITDEKGLAWARNLPPGRYRVIGEHPDGLRAKMTFEVKAQAGQKFNIAVR